MAAHLAQLKEGIKQDIKCDQAHDGNDVSEKGLRLQVVAHFPVLSTLFGESG